MGRLAITIEEQHDLQETLEEPIIELRTNLITYKDKYSSILFTSTQKREGKSTISFYVALSLSRCGKKVVWMNCNFHDKNKLMSFCQQESEETVSQNLGGLTEYLNGFCTWENIIYPVIGEKLKVIPCGTMLGTCDLFEKEAFLTLLTTLKQNYDYIIIDSPAAREYVDSRVIASKCDAVAFVIQYNKAKMSEVKQTIGNIRKCNGNIMGAILNNRK